MPCAAVINDMTRRQPVPEPGGPLSIRAIVIGGVLMAQLH
jgi:hypothetical protein